MNKLAKKFDSISVGTLTAIICTALGLLVGGISGAVFSSGSTKTVTKTVTKTKLVSQPLPAINDGNVIGAVTKHFGPKARFGFHTVVGGKSFGCIEYMGTWSRKGLPQDWFVQICATRAAVLASNSQAKGPSA